MKKIIFSIVVLAILFNICSLMTGTTSYAALDDALWINACQQLKSDSISLTKEFGRRNMLVYQAEVASGRITSASGIGTSGVPPFTVDRPVLLADGLSLNQFYNSTTKSIVYGGVLYQLGSLVSGEGETGDAVFVTNTVSASSFTTKIATPTQSANSDPERTGDSYKNYGGTLTFTDASSGYDKVSFMAASTGGYWNVIVASVRYTDGTFEEVKQFVTVPLTGNSTWDKINPLKTIYIAGGAVEPYFNVNTGQKYIDALASAIGAKAIIPFTQVQWLSSANNNMGITIPTQSSNFGGTGNNTAYVGIYDVPVSPAKTVKAIDFYNADSDTTAVNLGGEGVTSITGSGIKTIAHASCTDPYNINNHYDATIKIYRGNYGPFVFGATLYSEKTLGDIRDGISVDIEALTEESSVDEITGIRNSINEFIEKVKTILNSNDVVVSDCFTQAEIDKLVEYDVIPDEIQNVTQIFVSPDGNDLNEGTELSPLATLQAARDTVRNLDKTTPVEVIFNEGVYKFNSSVTFTASDSGTEENPITYKADGNVVFTTAKQLDKSKFTSITDQNILNRLSPSVKQKVLQFDLSAEGINAGSMPHFSGGNTMVGDGIEDIEIYYNNKPQTVAEFPNGNENYAVWDKSVVSETTTPSGAVAGAVRVAEPRAESWGNEKFAYLSGYFLYDWEPERITISHIEDKVLTFASRGNSLSYSCSKRYKIKHILEELDVPGEWYIDRDTNILYYYPYDSFENGELMISNIKSGMIFASDVCYVNFEGIKFDKIRGTAVSLARNVQNVNITGCEFSNISNYALNISGVTRGVKLPSIFTNVVDGAKDCLISDNRFINIGQLAIYINAGVREDLEEGNIEVSGNHFYNVGRNNRFIYNYAISLSGFGNKILHNEFHMAPQAAIFMNGNNHVIAYNEIYNVLRETCDFGAIYETTSLTYLETEVAYNYIHDYPIIDSRLLDDTIGVYLDERTSSGNVHHNIFHNGTAAFQNGAGQDNKFEYNIITDCDVSMNTVNRTNELFKNGYEGPLQELLYIAGYSGNWVLESTGQVFSVSGPVGGYLPFLNAYPQLAKKIATISGNSASIRTYLSQNPYLLSSTGSVSVMQNYLDFLGVTYQQFLAEYADPNANLSKYYLLSARVPSDNTFVKNVTNSPWSINSAMMALGGIDAGNVTGVNDNVFVDYENGDYRIKSDSAIYSYGMLSESFDINLIGRETTSSTAIEDFELTYPSNGATVADKKNIVLMWERGTGSDYFDIQIASDPEMNNIIWQKDGHEYNYITITDIPDDYSTFYWRVYAKNIGQNGSTQVNSGGVKAFKTLFDIVVSQEYTPSICFDISSDCNAGYFTREGVSETGAILPITPANYDLTKMNAMIGTKGYLEYNTRIYKFPQLASVNKVISTKLKNGIYTYQLKNNEKTNYSAVYMVVASLNNDSYNYRVNVNYMDGTTDVKIIPVISRYYTTYYTGQEIMLTVGGVTSSGSIYQGNENKFYEIRLDTNPEKKISSIDFVSGEYRSTTTGSVTATGKNEILIFALTGVIENVLPIGNNLVLPVMIKNYGTSEIVVDFISSGIKEGKLSGISISNRTIPANTSIECLVLEVPQKFADSERIKMFTWDNSTLKPYTPICDIKIQNISQSE